MVRWETMDFSESFIAKPWSLREKAERSFLGLIENFKPEFLIKSQ